MCFSAETSLRALVFGILSGLVLMHHERDEHKELNILNL